MSSKEWLLNPVAIRKAKECIHHIAQEKGVRVKLSQPNFLQEIEAYAQVSKNIELKRGYVQLARMSGLKIDDIDMLDNNVTTNIVAIPEPTPETRSESPTPAADHPSTDEFVTYQGKRYCKFNDDGKEFKGLYRGQARYS